MARAHVASGDPIARREPSHPSVSTQPYKRLAAQQTARLRLLAGCCAVSCQLTQAASRSCGLTAMSTTACGPARPSVSATEIEPVRISPAGPPTSKPSASIHHLRQRSSPRSARAAPLRGKLPLLGDRRSWCAVRRPAAARASGSWAGRAAALHLYPGDLPTRRSAAPARCARW